MDAENSLFQSNEQNSNIRGSNIEDTGVQLDSRNSEQQQASLISFKKGDSFEQDTNKIQDQEDDYQPIHVKDSQSLNSSQIYSICSYIKGHRKFKSMQSKTDFSSSLNTNYRKSSLSDCSKYQSLFGTPFKKQKWRMQSDKDSISEADLQQQEHYIEHLEEVLENLNEYYEKSVQERKQTEEFYKQITNRLEQNIEEMQKNDLEIEKCLIKELLQMQMQNQVQEFHNFRQDENQEVEQINKEQPQLSELQQGGGEQEEIENQRNTFKTRQQGTSVSQFQFDLNGNELLNSPLATKTLNSTTNEQTFNFNFDRNQLNSTGEYINPLSNQIYLPSVSNNNNNRESNLQKYTKYQQKGKQQEILNSLQSQENDDEEEEESKQIENKQYINFQDFGENKFNYEQQVMNSNENLSKQLENYSQEKNEIQMPEKQRGCRCSIF